MSELYGRQFVIYGVVGVILSITAGFCLDYWSYCVFIDMFPDNDITIVQYIFHGDKLRAIVESR